MRKRAEVEEGWVKAGLCGMWTVLWMQGHCAVSARYSFVPRARLGSISTSSACSSPLDEPSLQMTAARQAWRLCALMNPVRVPNRRYGI